MKEELMKAMDQEEEQEAAGPDMPDHLSIQYSFSQSSLQNMSAATQATTIVGGQIEILSEHLRD